MRLEPRTITLLGSEFLFIALSVLLFKHPELALGVFPCYGLIFLWSELRRESELPVIFSFLVIAAGVFLATRQPTGALQGAVAAELAAVLAFQWVIGLHRGRASGEQRRAAVETLELETKVKDDERDIRYYEAFRQSADAQIRLRRDLADCAKSLGSTLDAREVQARLSAILAARFPGARVEILGGGATDPLIDSALRKRGPVLVRDAAGDAALSSAIPGARAVVVVPLKVMHQWAGFLRLVSDQPGAFSNDDVKTADLIATMAALSLENIQFYEQVHVEATHDPLTQLFSHKAFQTRLQEELLRSGRAQTPLSIILCDIDHFKRYNDSYGHQAGDHLLRTVSAILASFARPVDMAARYGGEEFALILPNIVRSQAVELAERIRARIAGEPFVFQGQNTNATMSFGVASFPQDATSASQIVRAADERLYRAKEGGRNRVSG